MSINILVEMTTFWLCMILFLITGVPFILKKLNEKDIINLPVGLTIFVNNICKCDCVKPMAFLSAIGAVVVLFFFVVGNCQMIFMCDNCQKPFSEKLCNVKHLTVKKKEIYYCNKCWEEIRSK